MRVILNVSSGNPRYLANQARLIRQLSAIGEQADQLFWKDSMPSGSPSQQETPYAFKAYAILDAIKQGFDTLLWMDSSIVPVRKLAPLWELVEQKGYWFSANPGYGHAFVDPMSCGEVTCDSALAPLAITREELFSVPHVIATAFGLDLRFPIAQEFFRQFMVYAQDGRAFRGPYRNASKEASSDPRVRGHLHDQTVASVIAYRLGMRLTRSPKWIVDGVSPTQDTFLEIHR